MLTHGSIFRKSCSLAHLSILEVYLIVETSDRLHKMSTGALYDQKGNWIHYSLMTYNIRILLLQNNTADIKVSKYEILRKIE